MTHLIQQYATHWYSRQEDREKVEDFDFCFCRGKLLPTDILWYLISKDSVKGTEVTAVILLSHYSPSQIKVGPTSLQVKESWTNLNQYFMIWD